MDDRERQIIAELYALQLKLFDAQGEEIEALRRAIEALQESHRTVSRMLTLTGELIRPN